MVTEMNPHLDFSIPATWHQWEGKYVYDPVKNINKKVDHNIYLKKGTITELLGLIKLQLGGMGKHLFFYKWQGAQFEFCKENLKDGEVLMVMDFAKNLTITRQDEPQFAFWHRQSITMHPVVCYYRCKCPKRTIVTLDLMCVTDDKTHDAHAVYAFVQVAIKHLIENRVPVKKIYQFTDNCAMQYKSYLCFDYLSQSQIPTERHYFGSEHGKGPGDRLVGTTNRDLDIATRSRQCDLSNAREMHAFCDGFLTKKSDDPDKCEHYLRYYYLVESIDRLFVSLAGTVAGTQGFHTVRSCGKTGFIQVRDTSCFCG
jgi:hypothetical protein